MSANHLPTAAPSSPPPDPGPQIEAHVAVEEDILWLRPREDYPAYLRESTELLLSRRAVSRRFRGKRFDDDGSGHVVAVAVLRADAPSADSGGPGTFKRRYWWVKSYDNFRHGKPFGKSGMYRGTGCPAEAVATASVVAGRPSTPF